ncbi:MAG: Coenzyme F420 hydrogenase/dehydrogenase, beta subunit C-terminal domain [Acetatifactor sp.]|nr:Coenzyme F420 hydrogenase/dehydrogenase, beta subunit C-terminal domain [Acetatifactor sp.]
MSGAKFGFDISKLVAYSGYYIDDSLLKESSSGGAATALSEAVLARGGAVLGVTYTADFKGAEYCLVEQAEDLYKLKGSKYIRPSKEVFYDGERRSVYTVVASLLETGREVLFFGLGCVVAALYSFLTTKQTDTTKLFTVELICMGPTTPKVAEEYIDALEKRYRSKVCDFSVRYKKRGWTPSYLHAEFENGKKFETLFLQSEYGYAFKHYSFAPCYDCHFKGENHKADITVGDYWGISKNHAAYNENGVSLFLLQTQRGKELLSYIDTDSFHLELADVSFALSNNLHYFRPVQRPSDWEEFGKDLEQRGLFYAARRSQGNVKYFLRKAGIIAWAHRILPQTLRDAISHRTGK